MAQRDLYESLKRLHNEVTAKGGTESFRAGTIDIWEHRFVVSKQHVQREIVLEIETFLKVRETKAKALALPQSEEAKKLGGQYESEQYLSDLVDRSKYLPKISQVTDNFINKLKSLFMEKKTGFDIQIQQSGDFLEVIVRPLDNTPRPNLSNLSFLERKKIEKGSNPLAAFNLIQSVLSEARSFLINSLKTARIIEIPKSTRMFDLGHVTAVSALRAGQILNVLKQEKQEVLIGLLKYARVSELIEKNSELMKSFKTQVAFVKPQSRLANNVASHYDKAILTEVKAALVELFQEANEKNWAEAKGSNNIIDAIAIELAQTAKKKGASIKQTLPTKDRKQNKANFEEKLTAKLTTIKSTGTVKGVANEALQDVGLASSPTNLRSLIPMLNRRLPEIVRENMGQLGRLVNRTGRFAESTQIVDIDESSVVTYSYMLNPYQTFERQGARDPRTLIDMSIRELARGIITEKFSTRRV